MISFNVSFQWQWYLSPLVLSGTSAKDSPNLSALFTIPSRVLFLDADLLEGDALLRARVGQRALQAL